MTDSQREDLGSYYHYQRECPDCGNVWYGLHCPHDGVQTPCPNCGNYPKPRQSDSVCNCEFVIPVDSAKAKLAEVLGEIEEANDNGGGWYQSQRVKDKTIEIKEREGLTSRSGEGGEYHA